MNETQIEYRCANGHVQIIRYQGMTRHFAEQVAGLCDGTSPMYVFPPGPESTIGKCGICGAQLSSKVLAEGEVN